METAAAWRAIEQGLADEEPLRQRTEGLAVAIWGVTLPAMFVTFGLIHETQGHAGNPALGFLWVPWLLAGWMLTGTVWRLARLQSSRLPSARWPPWATALVFLGAYVSLAAALTFASPEDTSPTAMGLLGIATLWTLMAALDIKRRSRPGRRLDLALGALWFAAGLGLAMTALPAQVQTVLAAATTGLPTISIGLLRAWRA